jgi:hypothetical protein
MVIYMPDRLIKVKFEVVQMQPKGKGVPRFAHAPANSYFRICRQLEIQIEHFPRR